MSQSKQVGERTTSGGAGAQAFAAPFADRLQDQEGVFAKVVLAQVPPDMRDRVARPLIVDLNCDGGINFDDINPFVAILSS